MKKCIINKYNNIIEYKTIHKYETIYVTIHVQMK